MSPSGVVVLVVGVQGLVDSDSLPLNVSREMLQQHGALKTIKKKLVRKALDMIRKMADEDEKAAKDGGQRPPLHPPRAPWPVLE